jgi:endonuclease/exonuclease/phosphatase family metal-dependent hydrolase
MTFRLMTYNILDGGAGREAALTEVIRTAAPDMVIMPEVMQPAALERMASDLGMVWCTARGPERGRKVGALSRLPILGWRSLRSRWTWRECVEISVRLPGGQPLTIYGLHLVAFHSWLFEWWRIQEARGLLEHIRRAAPGPHLLAGDFNAIAPGDRAVWEGAPPWVRAQLWFQAGRVLHYALRTLLEAGYVDCFRVLHPHDDGFTLPAPDPKVRLDYVFADQVLSPALRECRVVAQPAAVKTASDHLPVLAEFEVEEGRMVL